jgi:CRP-like cAMP-binding protein
MNDRFKTGEGFSSFNKHSVIGKRENTLGPGTLFGETALDNDDARNATIKCDEDLEVLAIPKKFYKKAMAQVNTQKDFICANLPGAQFGYRLTHPATFFVMREFEQGHTFLHEGVRASERAVFCVYSGQVEVRRYRRATDSPAYVLAHRPLEEASWQSRCPPPPLGADGTLALARPSDGASKPALRDSVGRATVTTMSSFDMPELLEDGGPDLDDDDFGCSPGARTTGARCPADQVAIEVIERGSCFCPLSFYPLPGAEPLTMVAVSKTCKLLCATEQDVKVFPAKFIKAMRSSLMQDMTRRLRAIRKMDLETAQDVVRPDEGLEVDWSPKQPSRSGNGSIRSQVSRQPSQVSGMGGPSPRRSGRGSPSPGRSFPPSPAGGQSTLTPGGGQSRRSGRSGHHGFPGTLDFNKAPAFGTPRSAGLAAAARDF